MAVATTCENFCRRRNWHGFQSKVTTLRTCNECDRVVGGWRMPRKYGQTQGGSWIEGDAELVVRVGTWPWVCLERGDRLRMMMMHVRAEVQHTSPQFNYSIPWLCPHPHATNSWHEGVFIASKNPIPTTTDTSQDCVHTSCNQQQARGCFHRD